MKKQAKPPQPKSRAARPVPEESPSPPADEARNPQSVLQGGMGAWVGESEALRTSEQHYRLFQAILQSASDGILAVNQDNKVLFANNRFAEMWRIPFQVMAKKDDDLLLQYVLDQLSDPEGFLRKVRELYDSEKESFDTLYFKDGRAFDRLSRPMPPGMEPRGRVWSFRDITERKRAEAALRESEERYHSLFDRMMDGVYRSTHDGKFVDVNLAMVKMFGYSGKEEMLGVDIKKELYFAPEERGSHLLDTGQEEMDVYRMRRKDGSEIWVEDHGYYIHDKDGKIIFHEGMLRDVTKRKQADYGLAAERNLLSTLIDHLPDNIFIKDIDSRIVIDNIAHRRLLGVTALEDVVGKTDFDFFARNLAASYQADEQEIIQLGKALINREEPTVDRDGKQRWLLTTKLPLRDHQGKITGIVGINHDITERKRSEAALRESEERYHSLFDRMMDGVYRSTHDGKFVDVNPAMVKMFGYSSKEEMLGVDIKKELYFAPEERGSHLLDTGQEEMDVYRMRRKDGSEIWVEDHGYYIHDKDGKIIFHEGMLRDVTKRKQIENELSTSESELRALFASMHDAVLVIDREGVYCQIGPTNPGLLVKPPEELLGSHLSDVFPAERAETFGRVIQQVLDTKQNAQVEYDLTIDDRRVWFQTTISPLNADSTLWVAHDISNLKEVEGALRIAESSYRSIFENATVGIFQSTPEGRFLNVNPAMARIYGYDTPAEMVAAVMNIEKQDYVDPADRQEFQRLMVEQGEAREFTSWNYRKDGERIWTQESARAVKDQQGNILYYEGFVADITARKQAEEDLRRAKDGLETAMFELQKSLEREQLLASTDGLTGLINRRHFFELATREFNAAKRYRRPLAFLMFDVDDFKKVNDALGHTAGDKLLVEVAKSAAAQMRASDVVARYGGDEFIVLMPQATAQQALPVAERIRAGVAAIGAETGKEPSELTLSIGIAETRHEPADEIVERVIQRADEALYKAKQSGRNRSVIFGWE